MEKSILVTGGTGYIGSHTVVKLIERGFSVIVYDNLSNSSSVVVDRIFEITGRRPILIQADIRDRKALGDLFRLYAIDAVIHFAGLKAVGESVLEPVRYYENNVGGSIALLEEMALANVSKIIFSSSATVYGDPGYSQYLESTPVAPINPYGRTKLMVEDILRDIKNSKTYWRIAILRYFNPVGAHSSGMIGESPLGIPNNLMPFIAQVAGGKRSMLSIFGGDYPTSDGTALRDYVHVEDLASGHLAALDVLSQDGSIITANLGTGKPFSVLEMVRAFEKASGRSVPYQIVERRTGDLVEYYADPSYAKESLGWEAKYGIDQMCSDAWKWQLKNPKGY